MIISSLIKIYLENYNNLKSFSLMSSLKPSSLTTIAMIWQFGVKAALSDLTITGYLCPLELLSVFYPGVLNLNEVFLIA
jgi:hypothetical protein